MARKQNKSQSRLARRQALMREARAVRVGSAADVVVVGGGASGLVAAIVAAEAGASAVVLERELGCGLPILATGGGRCNFANLSLDVERYNDPGFVRAVCGEGWLGSVLAFFRASGLAWGREEDRLYPLSRSAASVRNVLVARARSAGVTLAPCRSVCRVCLPSRDGNASLVEYEQAWGEHEGGSIAARTVILATGGGALPQLRDLGLAMRDQVPVLCPLACAPSPLAELDGRRAHARARLVRKGQEVYRESGEVLFRSYGLSGIVIFNLSRRAAPGDLIELDLAPELAAHELARIADPLGRGRLAPTCLDGILHPDIARLVIRLAAEGWEGPQEVAAGQEAAPENAMGKVPVAARAESSAPLTLAGDPLPLRAARLAKALPFVVRGPAEGEQAQVRRGGLTTEQFDAATLSCRAHPWLFACGEALDIDGDCGGFNLAWAWKSGMIAGGAAAHRARG